MRIYSYAVRALVAACLVFGFTQQSRAEAEEPSEADWSAIQQVIAAQIEAFKHDDASVAYSYAAPGIQQQFSSAEAFMHMVRTGYGAVYRPASVRFLDHFVVAGQVIQQLQVVGLDDVVRVAFYIMERQADGQWKIAGCALKDAPAVSA